MYFRHTACLLLLVAPFGIASCIGTTEEVPYDAAAPQTSQSRSTNLHKPVGKQGVPCEPPELATDDLATVGSTPCEGTGFDEQERTWEPAERHHD